MSVASLLRADAELTPQQRLALRRGRWASLLTFGVMVGIGLSVLWVDWRAQVQVRKRAGSEIISAQAVAVQIRLNTAVSATYALAAVLRQRDYRVEPASFAQFAEELLRYHRGISALQYAPGGVIRYIEPLAGHEGALGHNLMADIDRNKEARRAIESSKLTLAGPFNLVQGGVGLAGRLPVFRPVGDRREEFWGFAIALIRVPELLKAANLSRLSDLGYRYRLSRTHPDTGEEQIFATESDPTPTAELEPLDDPVVIAFDVPNGVWSLAAEPVGGWVAFASSEFLLKAALVVIVAIALTMTLFTLMRQPVLLSQLVARRTRELEKTNEQLADEMAVRRQAEAQLRLSARVFEASAEAIMITDAEDRILTVNDAFTRMTGYTRQDAVGNAASLLDSGRHDAAFVSEMYRTLRRDGRWQGEVWSRRKNGELFPRWLGISVLTDSNGQVTHHVSIASDLSERKASEERIHYLAHYDALTGLPNRVLLRDRVQQAMAHADRQRHKVAVLLLDLDRFKVVNETLGHDVGDQLLQRVVDRLHDAVRASDTISRQGGDEFLIVVPELQGNDVPTRVAEQILKLLSQPFRIGDRDVRITASIGVAVYPDDASDFDTLMKLCDVAMYFAKESGRATYRFYNSDMRENSDDRLSLEADLAVAVENRHLELHFQPQIDLASDTIFGAEALVRWHHPERGMISPASFIPVAEETGLIASIGDWVLREACMQAKRWQAEGLPPIRVSVNLSGIQFRSEHLAEQVAAVLRETGLDAASLELELTESILLQDVEHVLKTMRELKQLGIQLAIDDFGTGYSSLSYLKRFSVDRLKIDQSFIRDLCADPDDAAIVQAVIQLGKSLNLETIAEGAESREQIAALREKGCMQVQGYYYSKPLPAEAFIDFVRRFQARHGTS